jgi:hypothetical protein
LAWSIFVAAIVGGQATGGLLDGPVYRSIYKNLLGIPWRVAFALQSDGWYLRQDIIWSKPNPMPESVTDRCTKAHEYIFLLSKSARYFYDADAVKEEVSDLSKAVHGSGYKDGGSQHKLIDAGLGHSTGTLRANGGSRNLEVGRNKRSVWTVATAPYPEAHFATYPPDLIKPCIMAGTSAKGCCAHRVVASGSEEPTARRENGRDGDRNADTPWLNRMSDKVTIAPRAGSPSLRAVGSAPVAGLEAEQKELLSEFVRAKRRFKADEDFIEKNKDAVLSIVRMLGGRATVLSGLLKEALWVSYLYPASILRKEYKLKKEKEIMQLDGRAAKNARPCVKFEDLRKAEKS